MDTVQDLAAKVANITINRFVVTGASKVICFSAAMQTHSFVQYALIGIAF